MVNYVWTLFKTIEFAMVLYHVYSFYIIIWSIFRMLFLSVFYPINLKPWRSDQGIVLCLF